MWARVRTILIVTLVTGLIWVWADAETQKDDLLRPPDTLPVEEARVTLARVPVLVALPASARERWGRVTPGVTELKDVTLVGPRGMIERIRRGEASLGVAAVVVLDEADLGASVVVKSVELMPAGAGLRMDGQVPTVRVVVGQ
ncbi:MAG: hypothetical protein K2Q09_01595 [Phycisphaerales bacterium]|nr:hypothetical protein [Phycisphaerales bacterium]